MIIKHEDQRGDDQDCHYFIVQPRMALTEELRATHTLTDVTCQVSKSSSKNLANSFVELS